MSKYKLITIPRGAPIPEEAITRFGQARFQVFSPKGEWVEDAVYVEADLSEENTGTLTPEIFRKAQQQIIKRLGNIEIPEGSIHPAYCHPDNREAVQVALDEIFGVNG